MISCNHNFQYNNIILSFNVNRHSRSHIILQCVSSTSMSSRISYILLSLFVYKTSDTNLSHPNEYNILLFRSHCRHDRVLYNNILCTFCNRIIFYIAIRVAITTWISARPAAIDIAVSTAALLGCSKVEDKWSLRNRQRKSPDLCEFGFFYIFISEYETDKKKKKLHT